MYLVLFIRSDNKPQEEYYYCHYEDALYHYSLFENDNSGLYSKIEIKDIEFSERL